MRLAVILDASNKVVGAAVDDNVDTLEEQWLGGVTLTDDCVQVKQVVRMGAAKGWFYDGDETATMVTVETTPPSRNRSPHTPPPQPKVVPLTPPEAVPLTPPQPKVVPLTPSPPEVVPLTPKGSLSPGAYEDRDQIDSARFEDFLTDESIPYDVRACMLLLRIRKYSGGAYARFLAVNTTLEVVQQDMFTSSKTDLDELLLERLENEPDNVEAVLSAAFMAQKNVPGVFWKIDHPAIWPFCEAVEILNHNGLVA